MQAVTNLSGYPVGGKRLKVAYARPQSKDIQNANLYVANIPFSYTEAKLKSLFDEFGIVIESRILTDASGKSRGVGFVRLDTNANAVKAVEARDQFRPEPNCTPLVVKVRSLSLSRFLFMCFTPFLPTQLKTVYVKVTLSYLIF